MGYANIKVSSIKPELVSEINELTAMLYGNGGILDRTDGMIPDLKTPLSLYFVEVEDDGEQKSCLLKFENEEYNTGEDAGAFDVHIENDYHFWTVSFSADGGHEGSLSSGDIITGEQHVAAFKRLTDIALSLVE